MTLVTVTQTPAYLFYLRRPIYPAGPFWAMTRRSAPPHPFPNLRTRYTRNTTKEREAPSPTTTHTKAEGSTMNQSNAAPAVSRPPTTFFSAFGVCWYSPCLGAWNDYYKLLTGPLTALASGGDKLSMKHSLSSLQDREQYTLLDGSYLRC